MVTLGLVLVLAQESHQRFHHMVQWFIVLGIAFTVWLLVLKIEGWAIVAGMLTLLAFFLLTGAPWVWLAVWVGNFLIFILRHKADFRRRPDLRAGVLGRFLP